ncbi:MAG TPA: polysaccharide deacetylase family protein [Cellvibrio sp.]|nr:polysaccharide deacetylase family protein [Cellvibrio sp.]
MINSEMKKTARVNSLFDAEKAPISRASRPLSEPPPILRDLKGHSDYLDSPLVCLTFDDGPDPLYTPLILDLLDRQQTSATFFVLGEAALRYPHLVELIVSAGHSLGAHTHSHYYPWMISSARARSEVSLCTAAIAQITGKQPRWFRPPYGHIRRAMIERASQEKMTTVLWNHSIVDWGPRATDKGIAQRLEEADSGDIVLMHDGARHHNRPDITARQLPAFLRSLTERGILPVSLDQVIC